MAATAYAPPANASTPENVPKMCHFRWRQEKTFCACLPHPIIDHFSAQKDLSVPLKLQATLSSPPLRLRALISSQLILIERGAKLGHLTSTSFRSWYATQDKREISFAPSTKIARWKFEKIGSSHQNGIDFPNCVLVKYMDRKLVNAKAM